jgi:transposase
VNEVTLDTAACRLDIRLDFPPRSQFPRPSDGKLCPVYDTQEKSWRHLNFFQYECYLHAWVPRVDGGEADGVKLVNVPWARPGSGFTLLMEALVVMMCQTGMTVAEAARMVSETAHRLWRVLFHHVPKAHEEMVVSEVKELSVDETSVRRGHDYVTVFCEPGHRTRGQGSGKPTRVLFVTEGRDHSTVTQAREFLEQRGVPAKQIKRICSDMSAAYELGIKENFEDAELVFDFFHTVSLITKAVDDVRRRERKKYPELLTGTRYLWLTNEANLSEEKRELRRQLCRTRLQTAKAFCHLEAFQDIFREWGVAQVEEGLSWWYYWVTHSRIPEMIGVAKTIKKHWAGVLAYLRSGLTNAAAEALNGIIQTVKRKCRGFRNLEYFKTMIYLVGSKLTFDLPCPVPTNPLTSS